MEPAAGVTVRAPEAVVMAGVTIEVPNVPVVPILRAFAAEIPPEVRIAPVVGLVVSRVDGINSDAEAPVPPIVRSVVAPAKAVKETEPVVIEVVKAGDVPNTATPLPVSFVSAVARFALVNEPSDAAFPTEVIMPVRLALVVTVPAVNPEAVPVSEAPEPLKAVLVRRPVDGLYVKPVSVLGERLPVAAFTKSG